MRKYDNTNNIIDGTTISYNNNNKKHVINEDAETEEVATNDLMHEQRLPPNGRIGNNSIQFITNCYYCYFSIYTHSFHHYVCIL
jgi:hypothetical protein